MSPHQDGTCQVGGSCSICLLWEAVAAARAAGGRTSAEQSEAAPSSS